MRFFHIFALSKNKMAKSKFRFNPDTLQYEKIERSFKRALGMVLSYLVIIVVVGFAFMFTWLHFFPSSREKQLIDENKSLRNQYKTLNNRLSNMETVLDDLADKDNNIYRMVFESEPIPSEIRNGGFGGVNRYAELEEIPNMEIVVQTNKRMDILRKKIYIQSLSFDTIVNLAKNKQIRFGIRNAHAPDLQDASHAYRY